MRNPRAVLPLILLLGALTAPLPGFAQEQAPLRLAWDAPPSCPDRTQVEERVRAYLKLERWPARSSFQVVASGRVSIRDRALALDLEVRGKEASTQRTLLDTDCEVLANGAALLIAMALAPALESSDGAGSAAHAEGAEPSAGSGEHSEAATRTPSGTGVAQATTTPATSAEQHTSQTEAATRAAATPPASASPVEGDSRTLRDSGGAAISPRFAVGAGVSLASDLMPEGPALGAEVAGELRLRPWPWRFGLSVGITPARSDRLESYPAARLRTSAAMLAAWPCYEWSFPPMSLGLCLYVEVGRIDASLRAIDEPQRSRSFWVAGGGGLSLGYEASRHVLVVLDGRVVRASNDLHFFIATPSGEIELHHTGPLGARLSLRLEWLF